MIRVKLEAESEEGLSEKEDMMDERFGPTAILEEIERGIDGQILYAIFALTIRDDGEIEALPEDRLRFVKLAATSGCDLLRMAGRLKSRMGSFVVVEEVRRGVYTKPDGLCAYAVFLVTFYPI